MELGYWSVKGGAEPLKWLAAYLALEIKELNFETEEDLQERMLELSPFNPFMSVPYLKFENQVITQKRAVAQALALKADRAELFGEGEEDQVTVSTLLGVIGDLESFVLKIFEREEEDVRANIEKEMEEKVIPKFESLNSFIGDRFFFMHYITFADFELAYLKEIFDILVSKIEGFQNPFERFHFLNRMVRELKLKPGLRQYVEAEAYQEKQLFFPTSFLLQEEEELVEEEEEVQVEGGEELKKEAGEEGKPAVEAPKDTTIEGVKTEEGVSIVVAGKDAKMIIKDEEVKEVVDEVIEKVVVEVEKTITTTTPTPVQKVLEVEKVEEGKKAEVKTAVENTQVAADVRKEEVVAQKKEQVEEPKKIGDGVKA